MGFEQEGRISETHAGAGRAGIAPGRLPATAKIPAKAGGRVTANATNPAAEAPAATPTEPGMDPFGMHLVGEKVQKDLELACDAKPGGPGCFLTEKQVMLLMRRVDLNITNIRENWTTALLSKRIDLASVRHEGWNILWKGAAMLAMAALGAGVGLGLEFVAEAAESVTAIKAAAAIVNREETVHQLFEVAGGVLEGKAEKKVNEAANEGTAEQSAYLKSQLDKPASWANSLTANYPKKLDHYGMVLLYGMTNPAHFSVEAFTAQIETMLAQFEHQVQKVGEVAGGNVETVAWVFPRGGGSPRLARVMAWLPPGEGKRDNNLVAKSFQTWVSKEMEPLSLEKAGKERVHCSGMTTLADLDNAPSDKETQTWDRGTLGEGITEEVYEPEQVFSQEDAR